MTFLDTSAIYALADRADRHHRRASTQLDALIGDGQVLLVHNYVIAESIALLQHRLGLASALKLADDSRTFEMVWVDQAAHDEALAQLRRRNRRQVSLVDVVSFHVMRSHGVQTAFAFDPHFREEGFRVIPAGPVNHRAGQE